MPTIRIDDEVWERVMAMKHEAEMLFGRSYSMNEAVRLVIQAAEFPEAAKEQPTAEERKRVKEAQSLAQEALGKIGL